MDKLRSGQEEKSALLCFRENYADKELRARIHMYFKNTVKLYETDTVVDHANEGNRLIRLFLVAGMSNKNRKRQNLTDKNRVLKKDRKSMPEYLQVVVRKENLESMQAIHYISKRLKKMPKYFSFAGNKDKRGITTQKVTIMRCNAEQIIR
jgi:tRNA pseudouridine13 synthase